MADLEKTVKIIFEGDDQLSKTVNSVTGKFSGLENLANTIAGPLANAADKVMMMDTALAALAIGGLALAIKKAGEFSGKFGEVTTLIQDTGEPIDAFRRQILDYSTDSVKSVGDINQALYNAISAGVDYKDSVDFVSAAEKLSVAGRAELGETTKVLISVLNAYGASTTEAAHYSDVMFTTVRLGQTTLEQLSRSLAMVTGLASTSGIPFETLSAAIASLTVSGLPTEQAITGIRQAIQNIIKPSSEAKEVAASLGLQFDATALKTKGLEGVLWDAYTATGGNISQMGQLFGSVESLNAVMILGADKTGKFKEALAAMGEATGATQTAYNKLADEFENVNQRMKNNIDVTLIDIGTRLMPGYKDMAKGLSDVFNGLKIAVDAGAFDPLFKLLESAGSEIREWLQGVAKALPRAMEGLDFDKLTQSLRNLGGAFAEYLGDLDLTKVEDLHEFIQLLIDGIAGLINVTAGMVEGFRPFFEVIKDFLVSAAESDEQTQRTIGIVLALGKMVDSVGLAFVVAAEVIDRYGLSVQGVFNVIAGGAQIMWNGLQLIFDAIKGSLVLLGGLLVEFLKSISFGLIEYLFPGINAIEAKLTKWGQGVSNSIWQNGADAKAGLDRMAEGFKQLGAESGRTGQSIGDTTQAMNKIPAEKKTNWRFEGGEEIRKTITEIGKEIVVKGKADKDSFQKAKTEIDASVPQDRYVVVGYVEDETGRHEIREKIAETIPDKKTVKVDTQLETTKIKEESAIIQKAMEWKAKLDITAIEEGTKRLKDMFSSIDTGITSTGDVIGDLLSALTSGESAGSSWLIRDMLEDENDRRDQQFELQKDLITQQKELMQLKIDAMKRGDNIIQVEAAGLQPHLEMILWEVLEAVQLRANADAAEFLLGV